MGCKTSTNNEGENSEAIKEKINQDRLNSDKLSQNLKSNVNEKIIQADNFEFNILAYALYKGKYKSFRYIVEILNGNLQLMENLLLAQGMNPLSICCSHGNLELFKYYFGLTQHHNKRVSMMSSEGLKYKQSELLKDDMVIIQQAVLQGFINIASYLYTLTGSTNNIPDYLNIHYIEPVTGENCALVACRSGNYTMIKYIFEIGGNYHIRNKKAQSAIQVLANDSKYFKNCDFFNCFKFLIGEVNVQYSHDYEDILLNISDAKTVEYFEKLLEKSGVYVTKKEIETIYKEGNSGFKDARFSETDKLSFLSQASVLGTVNQKDNV